MAQRPAPSMSMTRLGVSKENGRIVAITAIAAFLVVFFLVAAYSLFGTLTYQNRVIKAKKTAVTQLRSNLTARDSLVRSYQTFADAPVNYIGGSATGNGPQDGNNARIVLDALPGTYDFPALAASLEKMAFDQKVSIAGLTGSDDQVAQSEAGAGSSEPVEIPFEMKVNGDYLATQRLISAFDRSIRPIQLKSMKISGDTQSISLEVQASTYYQPAKTFTVQKKVVK